MSNLIAEYVVSNRIALEYLHKKVKELEKNSVPATSLSLLHLFLQNDDLDKKDILGVMVDFLLAGIDTVCVIFYSVCIGGGCNIYPLMTIFIFQTAYTASFALYHLARNKEKQENMFAELNELTSVEGFVTEDMLQKSVYTKAVIKEVHRMNPVSVGVGRILAEDALLSNYHVPAGVNISRLPSSGGSRI